MIEITEEEYKQLKRDSRFLTALEVVGVDNWDGYDYALELLSDMGDDE